MTKQQTSFGKWADSKSEKLRTARAAWRKRTGGCYKVKLRAAIEIASGADFPRQ